MAQFGIPRALVFPFSYDSRGGTQPPELSDYNSRGGTQPPHFSVLLLATHFSGGTQPHEACSTGTQRWDPLLVYKGSLFVLGALSLTLTQSRS
jgi:hypothetical protein